MLNNITVEIMHKWMIKGPVNKCYKKVHNSEIVQKAMVTQIKSRMRTPHNLTK